MKRYWVLNSFDFAMLKLNEPEISKWAEAIETETVRIGGGYGYDVPRGHVLDEGPNGFGLKPFAFVIETCGHSHERAVALLRRIP